MYVLALYGFNDEDYKRIKEELKKELSFKFTVRRCRRKYAPNAISILPVKSQDYRFTPEQVDRIFDFLSSRAIYDSGGRPFTKDNPYYENRYLVYSHGFEFLMRITAAKSNVPSMSVVCTANSK